MIKTMLYFHFKNAFRKYIRIISQYPFYAIVLCISAFFFIPVAIEFIYMNVDIFTLYFPYIILLYAILKYTQHNPLITIRLSYFQFKLFTFNQLKGYILWKITWPSLLTFLILSMITETFSTTLAIALLFNIAINYLCFIRYQIPSKILTFFILLAVILIGFYALYANMLLISIFVIAICVLHLISIKKFDYTVLYFYYKTMNKIGEGLLNKDFTKIFEAQQILSKPKTESDRQAVLKYYHPTFYYFIYREHSKLRFHQKEVMNVLIGFIILNLLYVLPFIPYKIVAYSIALFLINYVQDITTKQELKILKKSTIFNIKNTNYLKMKYFVNLLLTLILFILNSLIFKDFFLIACIIIWIIPFLNIMLSYIDQKLLKWLFILIQGVIYGIPYLLIFLT